MGQIQSRQGLILMWYRVKELIMNKNIHTWLSGLISFIASGVLTGIGAMGIRPEAFNFSNGLGNLSLICAWSGFIALLNYLKQSPMPKKGKSW